MTRSAAPTNLVTVSCALHLRSLACVLFLAAVACGPALPRAPSCGMGRTLLDGVCVGEAVADYVSCVRAQGAQLAGDRGARLSAAVGYAGAKSEVADEVREKLEKKYSVSQAAELEIIRACNGAAGRGAAPAAPPVVADWKPPKAGAYTLDSLEASLETIGEVVAKSDFNDTAPKLLDVEDTETFHSYYADGRFVHDLKSWTGNHVYFVASQEKAEHFLLSVDVNLVAAVPGGGAQVVWWTGSRFGTSVSFDADGGIWLDDYDGAKDTPDDKRKLVTMRSATAVFRPNVDTTVVIRHAHGRVDVWVDGQRAIRAMVQSRGPFSEIACGARNTGAATPNTVAKVAFDNLLLVKLP